MALLKQDCKAKQQGSSRYPCRRPTKPDYLVMVTDFSSRVCMIYPRVTMYKLMSVFVQGTIDCKILSGEWHKVPIYSVLSLCKRDGIRILSCLDRNIYAAVEKITLLRQSCIQFLASRVCAVRFSDRQDPTSNGGTYPLNSLRRRNQIHS